MDSDDVSVPYRFEQQLKYFASNPNIDIIGGDITEFVGEESNVVGKRAVPEYDAAIKDYMKTRCAMNHVTVMYRKSAVQAAGLKTYMLKNSIIGITTYMMNRAKRVVIQLLLPNKVRGWVFRTLAREKN